MQVRNRHAVTYELSVSWYFETYMSGPYSFFYQFARNLQKHQQNVDRICLIHHVPKDECYIIQYKDLFWISSREYFNKRTACLLKKTRTKVTFVSNVDHKMTHFIPRFFFFPFLSLSGFAAATFWVRISRIKS